MESDIETHEGAAWTMSFITVLRKNPSADSLVSDFSRTLGQ